MGDEESCLFRQQTREVREKPLINYRFLRAAASVVLRDLPAVELWCPAANAAIAASPASPGPSAVGLATQFGLGCPGDKDSKASLALSLRGLREMRLNKLVSLGYQFVGGLKVELGLEKMGDKDAAWALGTLFLPSTCQRFSSPKVSKGLSDKVPCRASSTASSEEPLKQNEEMATKEKLQCLKDFHKDILKPSPGKSPGTRPEDEAEGKPPQREKWSSKIDFVLSVAGGFVGLGNVWRFPYLCYKNGGGAFLIPYFIFLFGSGLPVFFLEVIIGQYTSEGGITCWEKICPLFSGIGYASIVIVSLLNVYYIVILAWATYYLFQSFQNELPWAHCNHSWNTPQCMEDTMRKNESLWVSLSTTNFTSPVIEFWERNVLSLSSGIDHPGALKWDLALCLLLVWLVCFFCIWKGVRSTGK
ncbi:hypothetical protein STEG23_010660, partial [Scotinomys teguina]